MCAGLEDLRLEIGTVGRTYLHESVVGIDYVVPIGFETLRREVPLTQAQ